MDPFLILILSIINFLVGFFAVSVGGSGLIMTPILLSFGVPAPSAVAVKRFSNIGLSTGSLYKFHKSGKVFWRVGFSLILVSVLAAYIAANIVLTLDRTLLARIIAVVIIATIIFMLVNKRFGLEEKAKKMRTRNKVLGNALYFVAVFTSHISGGGGGIFTSQILIHFHGMTFLQSAGTRKVAGTFGTIMAISIYIIAGVIPFGLAIPMLIAGTTGGWLGTHYAITKGDVWVRKLFLVILALLAVRLLLF